MQRLTLRKSPSGLRTPFPGSLHDCWWEGRFIGLDNAVDLPVPAVPVIAITDPGRFPRKNRRGGQTAPTSALPADDGLIAVNTGREGSQREARAADIKPNICATRVKDKHRQKAASLWSGRGASPCPAVKCGEPVLYGSEGLMRFLTDAVELILPLV